MSLANIHYAVDDDWDALPDWASYFLFLGFFIASQPKTDARAIIGVALPTRAYAAVLAATGIIYNRTVLAKNRVEADAHFQSLCKLPSGTSITYLHGQRNLNGLLLGCTDKFGEKMLIVETRSPQSLKQTYYVRSSDAIKIQQVISEAQTTPAPRHSSKRQTGKLVTPASEFTRNLLGEENAADLSYRSRLECFIIGQLSVLRQEANEPVFAMLTHTVNSLRSRDEFHQGTLQDVLRVRKFMGEGKAYRTDVVAAQSENVPSLARDEVPHVTVFDGAAGFTKWHDYWRASHWLVLLDSTESGFDEAARLLNTE